MEGYEIIFEPLGLRGECLANDSLLSCARRLGAGINSVCGGHGKCQSCKIQVLSGMVNEPSSDEAATFSKQELRDGWRLACQVYPMGDCKIRIPADSMTTSQRTQVEGLEVSVIPEPPVQTYYIKVQEPLSANQQADADRLLHTMNEKYGLQCSSLDIDILRCLSPKLRSLDWECQVSVRDNEVVAIGDVTRQRLGLAVDLGTTKVAAYLIDINEGKTLVSKGIMNPQTSYGEDIISRISHIINKLDESMHLQKITANAIDNMAADLCNKVGADKEDIVEVVVIGNTAMHHIFLGLPVRQLTFSPFSPVVSQSLDVKARELGLKMAPGAYVHIPPNIAGFVGSDHVSMLLATQEFQDDGPVICLDIGTNTEVSLVSNGNISTVSCASGPAFEGGHIKHGMRAAGGAIERLRIEGDGIQCQTIDNMPPTGICGSGILDTVAQLYLAGVIDKGGRIQENKQRVRTRNKQREFVLMSTEERNGKSAIVITQGDIREVQLAKAAIRTGIETLLHENGCSHEDIEQVVVAGAFGSYIDINSALKIGMFPPISPRRFQQVGNAAGAGARIILTSLTKRNEARSLASAVRYIELASNPEFNRIFTQASYLGQYKIA